MRSLPHLTCCTPRYDHTHNRCPPCRRFTPLLAATYEKLKAAGKPFEVVFVSSDEDGDQFKEYLAEMPWLALPFGSLKAELSRAFDVDGIPTLVILGPDGEVVTDNGTHAVRSDPEGSEFPWRPKLVNALDGHSVGAVNKGPVVVAVLGGGEAAAAADGAEGVESRGAALLTGAAEAEQAASGGGSSSGDGLHFLFSHKGNELLLHLMQWVGALRDEEEVVAEVVKGEGLLLIDAEESRYVLRDWEEGLTPGDVDAFVSQFRAGTLEGARKLGGDDGSDDDDESDD